LMAIEGSGSDVSGTASLAVYVTVFEKLGLLAVVIGIGLMLVAPRIAKRMH
jgi:dipeptide/tripeptide permease